MEGGLCCIPKILKNESNSQQTEEEALEFYGCVVSQRYLKMKAIHNLIVASVSAWNVVLYPKDT